VAGSWSWLYLATAPTALKSLMIQRGGSILPGSMTSLGAAFVPTLRSPLRSRHDPVVENLVLPVMGWEARSRGQFTESAPLPDCGWSSRPSRRVGPRPGPGGTRRCATPGAGRQFHGRSTTAPGPLAPRIKQTWCHSVGMVPRHGIRRRPRPLEYPRLATQGDAVPRRADPLRLFRTKGSQVQILSPRPSDPGVSERIPGVFLAISPWGFLASRRARRAKLKRR